MTLSGSHIATPRPLVFQKQDNELRPEAASLAEYYAADAVKYEARELDRALEYVGELQHDDQSSLDTDPRDLHVVIPEHRFESHPDAGFRLEQERFKLTGQGEVAEFTSTAQETMLSSGAWDRSRQTLTVHPKKTYEAPTSYADGATNLLVQEDFSYQAEGPAPEKEDGQRAVEILSSVAEWETEAARLDASDSDLNPNLGEIVAAHVSAPSSESVMTSTFAGRGPNGEANFAFTGYDLEMSPDRLLVAGSFGQGPGYGATLESSRQGSLLSVVLSRPELGLVEKVEWNTSDAVLHYEKLKKG